MNTEDYKIEIVIVLIALFCTVFALVVSYWFPELQILVLTILTLLLPAIYQVGHIFIKEYTRGKNERDYSNLQYATDNLIMENEGLRRALEAYGEEFEENVFDFSSSESGKKLL